MSDELLDRLALAERVARVGGAFALERFDAGLVVETKEDGTPVTEADRGAEAAMREVLAREVPSDAVAGEEHGVDEGRSGWRWVLDPIDGTKSFVRGVPLWSTLVGLVHEGRAVVGVLALPALGETLSAATGAGCRRDGGRTPRVSDVGDPGRGLLCLSAPWADHRGVQRLAREAGLVRTWGDAYGYFLVATGRAEWMVDPAVSVWDVAAIQPIVEEAGGRFTDLAGAARHDGGSGVASNGRLHDRALRLLRDEADER